jgi:hypothetical protein
MLRTFFSAIGVLFLALLLFCASFLVNVAIDLDRARSNYAIAAVDITRELSRTWKLSAIEKHYGTEARQELLPVLDADMTDLAALGPLLEAGTVHTDPLWLEPPGELSYSAPAVADRLAALLNRTVEVAFTAKFAGGSARVSAELKREGRSIRLWRLRIETLTPPKRPEEPQRRVISHA